MMLRPVTVWPEERVIGPEGVNVVTDGPTVDVVDVVGVVGVVDVVDVVGVVKAVVVELVVGLNVVVELVAVVT